MIKSLEKCDIDDMDELESISKGLKEIKFEKRLHPGLTADAKTTTIKGIDGDPLKLYDWMIKEFGHSICGKWQFLYSKGGEKISCIRGSVSFGSYEIYATEGSTMEDPERFETAEECLKRIKELLQLKK